MFSFDQKAIDTQEILSQINIHNKYSKYLPDKQRRENWKEVVSRDENMLIKKFPFLEGEIKEAFKLVYDKKILPSMRFLQFAGLPIEVNPSRGYNCSYLPIDHFKAFGEICFLLLSGVGCGVSVQKHHIAKLPEIKKPKKSKRYLIGDSIEGWADAVNYLFKAYLDSGYKPIFDYRDIRPKGARLVTSGGKAPGSGPLKICLTEIETILENKKEGDKLTSLEIFDCVCHIADCILAGGIRRAAVLTLFSLDDTEMFQAKHGNWYETNPQRARSNNSVYLNRNSITRDQFNYVWEQVKLSGSGEPGIFFSNDDNYDMGCNPCCFTGDTLVVTEDNYFGVPIKELAEKSNGINKFNVYSSYLDIKKEKWVPEIKKATAFKTGKKVIYEIFLSNGSSFKCTDNHKLALLDGNYIEAKDSLGKELNSARLVKHKDLDSLFFCSEYCKVVKVVNTGVTEDVYDLEVEDNHNFYILITSKIDYPEAVLVHNCEISLRPFTYCNLVETNVSDIESQEDLNKRVKAAAFISTLQASFTDFHFLRSVWKKSTEEDSLIGVSMTGISDGEVVKYDLEKAANVAKNENIRISKLIDINPAKRVCCIKPSGSSSLVLKTASGIHSRHAPYYWRRIRIGKNESIYTYLSINAPELLEDDLMRSDMAIIKICIKSPEKSIYRDEKVLDFLERVKFFHEHWIKPGHNEGINQNNVSCTVSIKENEWEIVGSWMWDNKEHYTGLSVLPYDGGTYIQTPYEDCTEKDYLEFIDKIKDININLDDVIELDDNTDHQGESACSGGKCEIV